MIEVALVTPPNIGHFYRGGDFYLDRLKKALSNIPQLLIHSVNLSFSPWAYRKFRLVHFPYFDPFFLTLPPVTFTKSVVTVFDLTPIVLADFFPRGLRGELKWWLQKRSLERASRILTISKSSKSDIARLTNFPLHQIDVTYLAAGDEFHKVSDKKLLSQTKLKYRLPDHFVMYLGDVNANKNLSALLEAFKIALPDLPLNTCLLLIGGAVTNKTLPETKTIHHFIDSLGLEKRVLLPGFVPDADLVNLFNLATVYVQPSIYEGFGLPVVQALACGVPVITGQNSSFPEIVGQAGLFADVTSPASIAEKILEVFSFSDNTRRQLAKKSIDQASNFTWHQTAQTTYESYKRVLEKV